MEKTYYTDRSFGILLMYWVLLAFLVFMVGGMPFITNDKMTNKELLEARGTGNASKSMYVFKKEKGKYLYMGELNANPDFEVYRDNKSNKIIISYYHRFGADEGVIKKIEYKDNTFVEMN